jgi:hypothetical protein
MIMPIDRGYNDSDTTVLFVEGEWIILDNLTGTLLGQGVIWPGLSPDYVQNILERRTYEHQ